jgi:hypothetical protein
MEDSEKQLGISQQAKPETSEEKSERVFLSSALESKRKIAAATGKFYNLLLDTYLKVKTPEERQVQITSLIDSLPRPMKKLYGEGLGRFQEELRENHALLEKHREMRSDICSVRLWPLKEEAQRKWKKFSSKLIRQNLLNHCQGWLSSKPKKIFSDFLRSMALFMPKAMQ